MKETFAERQERLVGLYQKACLKGLCTSRGGFAELVGVSRQTMSSAMNGSEEYLTAKLVDRAERVVCPEIYLSNDANMENSGNAHDNVQKNFGAPEADEPKSTDITEIVKTLTDELAKERESHERIMLALIQKIGQK